MIIERLEQSNKKIHQLEKKILARFQDRNVLRSPSEIEREFGDLVTQFNLLLEKGEIIPEFKGQSGVDFILSILNAKVCKNH